MSVVYCEDAVRGEPPTRCSTFLLDRVGGCERTAVVRCSTFLLHRVGGGVGPRSRGVAGRCYTASGEEEEDVGAV